MSLQDTSLHYWRNDFKDLPDDDFGPQLELRKTVLERICEDRPGTSFCKTHCANVSFNGVDFIPKDLSAGGIYVVRDPREVATSCSRFFGESPKKSVKNMVQDGHCLSQEGVLQYLGNWSGHVESWGEALTIRYEDMRDSPQETFGKILEDLHLPTERLDRAIEYSGLSELKEQEDHNGFREFSEGFFGRDKPRLNQKLKRRIETDHGAVMSKLGYK